jgi:hypothetical protein
MSEKPMSSQWSDSQMDRINLRAENGRLREQVAGLEKMLREVQEFVSLVEYSDAFDNIYWAMHEDMKTAIDAALAASPAPTPAEDSARTTAPATEERQ